MVVLEWGVLVNQSASGSKHELVSENTSAEKDQAKGWGDKSDFSSQVSGATMVHIPPRDSY